MRVSAATLSSPDVQRLAEFYDSFWDGLASTTAEVG
jgi:hypothetical protein